jgi:hypothetical protein
VQVDKSVNTRNGCHEHGELQLTEREELTVETAAHIVVFMALTMRKLIAVTRKNTIIDCRSIGAG